MIHSFKNWITEWYGSNLTPWQWAVVAVQPSSQLQRAVVPSIETRRLWACLSAVDSHRAWSVETVEMIPIVVLHTPEWISLTNRLILPSFIDISSYLPEAVGEMLLLPCVPYAFLGQWPRRLDQRQAFGQLRCWFGCPHLISECPDLSPSFLLVCTLRGSRVHIGSLPPGGILGPVPALMAFQESPGLIRAFPGPLPLSKKKPNT